MPRAYSSFLFVAGFCSWAQTASIAGKVTDAAGAPVKRAVVSISTENAEARNSRTMTGDDGSFVIKELAKGKYWITAEKNGFLRAAWRGRTPSSWGDPIEVEDGKSKTGIDITLQRQGVIAGRVVDEAGEPADRVQVQVIDTRAGTAGRGIRSPGATTTDDRGEFRISRLAPGTYKLLATRPNDRSVVLGERAAGKQPTMEAPTYFPGTLDAASATTIKVNAGEERTGAEIRLQRSVVVQVSGTVTGDVPQPARRGGGMVVTLRPNSSPGGFNNMMRPGGGPGGGPGAETGKDGSFLFRNVRPGDYTLTVSSYGRGGPLILGRQPLSVGQQDIAGVSVTASAPVEIKGKLRAEGNPPFEIPRMQIGLTGSGGAPVEARSSETGEFTFNAVSRDRYTLNARTPTGMIVKSVFAAGQPLPGLEIDFATVTGPIEILLSNKPAAITGTVEGTSPDAPRIAVWAVPDAQPLAITGLNTTKIRVESSASSFSLENLRPGTYRVAAFENADSNALNDPAFWDQFRERIATVKVDEGETGQAKIKLISAKEIDEN